MNVFERRRSGESMLEKRFIQSVLKQESEEIRQDQNRIMSRFKSADWKTGRDFQVRDTTMEMTHLPKHRFTDMKSRNTKGGRIKKKNHPIHNRILYGHANNIVRGIKFGFTEQVKQEMRDVESKSK